MLSPTELGLVLAVLTAALKGIQDLVQKHSAVATDEYVTGWSARFFGLLVLVPVNLYYGIPRIEPAYLYAIVPMGIAIAATSIMIARAYRLSDVSVVSPMFATGPMLTVITAFLILGEQPSLPAIAGVVLISVGAYLLKADGTADRLAPLRRLASDRGVQLIVLVVIIYSITATIDKIGLTASSPVFWALSTYTLSAVIMFPIMVRKTPDWREKLQTSWRPLLVLGLLGGCYIILQLTAIRLTLVANVIAIKRLSMLLAVLGGVLVFEEGSIRQRLGAAAVMVTGVILIAAGSGSLL